MKNQRDKLRQYQKRITVITDRERAIAKECLTRGDKEKALLALRRKKYQESLLAKTDSQLEQLEKLTSSVEFALVQKDVLYGLKQGTQVLQQIHKEMGGLEAVEKLMGESEEARAYQQVRIILASKINYSELQFWLQASHQLTGRILIFYALQQEISEALAGQMSNQDEDEVEEELERMEKEANAVDLPKAPWQPLTGEVANGVQDTASNQTMPDVPTTIASEALERLQKQKERAKARRVALHA
jgi:charged multivesicular body protein 6